MDLFSTPTPSQKTQRLSVKRSKKSKPRNVGIKRNTGGASQILEYAAKIVRMVNFHIYDFPLYRDIESRSMLPPSYLVTGYRHQSLYGTSGKKEGFISHNGSEYIFEAKWQKGSGSVDEKIPYIWEHFLSSSVANWIVWFDGPWWRDKRGKAAVTWLRDRAGAQCPSGRRLIILNGDKEALDFFHEEFGRRQ